MAKRKNNVILAYVITIILTFVLLGGTAIYLYNKLYSDDNDKTSSAVDNSQNEIPKIEITSEFNRTLLLVLNAGNLKEDSVFVVARFIAPDKKLIILPVSGDTYTQINTEKDTVYNFYRKGGIIKVTSAIENALDIKIEKYIEFDKDSFQSMTDILGGVTFFIPYDLINENEETGESVVIRSGQQYLDGTRLRQLFTFKEFTDGEQYRSKIVGVSVADMINNSLGERLENTLDTTFNTMINQVNSNITAYDYKYRKDAIVNCIVAGEYPVQYTLCSGGYNDEEQFVIDESFKENLKTLFAL